MQKPEKWWKVVVPALVLARREIRDQLRDWRIIFPVLGLTIFFPFLMNFTADQMLNFVREYGANIIGLRLVPFLLMITGFFPISVSMVVALESFVGEKERGSIEPLLNTPLKDWQLYVGKLISSTIPPLLSSFVGMAVYLAGLSFNQIAWPEPNMLVQIFALIIVQAFMMVSGAVVVSSQATSVRSANLLASFIIIPSAFLVQGEALLMFWGNYESLWWAVLGLAALTVLLVRVGLAHFRREELLGREIDVLNLRWGWGVFWKGFLGEVKSPWEWYRRVIPATLRRLGWSLGITTLVCLAGLWIGGSLVERFPLLIDRSSFEGINQNLSRVFEVYPALQVRSMGAVFWQNLRVLLLALVLGAFTFGVMGLMPLLATMAVAGYLMNVLSQSGLPVVVLFAGLILPHGMFEIPAAVISVAAVLQMGAVLATPDPTKTVGEVWLTSLADWAKVMVGVVIPLLLAASAVEIWVTPRIALWLFR